jgi:hypothetical protein
MNWKVILVVVAGALFPFAGMAADPVQIGKFNDWRAYTYDDPGGKICYVVSEPKEAKGKYTSRGDVYFLVTHRPKGDVFEEVSMIAGYTYKQGSEPLVTVNRRKFKFYTEGDAAWVFQKDESALVKEMKAGATMLVQGTSSRGTLTTDTYSLSGVTAALRAIDKECGRK